MSVLDVLLIGLAALVTAYLLLMLIITALPLVRHAPSRIGESVTAPFSETFRHMDRERRFEQLDAEVRRALGQADSWGSQERAEIVEAALAAQQITALNRILRKTVGQCLNTHWAVASGLAATDMGEAARHPWSNGLRQRVIDVSELLSQRLEAYPLILDAPELIRLQLGIRWIGPTCATCPYWTTSVADAPRICPTAKAIGHGGSTQRPNVADAEVVNDCEGDLV
ncbi:MAG TPA: hypothetical protein VI485_16180 [Vicinamibacterales bacterium]|nr:hypothetical protein [Vicinamibacterales bacterium]